MKKVQRKLPSPTVLTLFALLGIIFLGTVATITIGFIFGYMDYWDDLWDDLLLIYICILLSALFCALNVWFLVTVIVHSIRTRKGRGAIVLAVITFFAIIIWFVVAIISNGLPGDTLFIIIAIIPLVAFVSTVGVWLVVTVIVFSVSGLFRLMVRGKDG